MYITYTIIEGGLSVKNSSATQSKKNKMAASLMQRAIEKSLQTTRVKRFLVS